MKYFKKIIGDRIYLSPKSVFDDDIERYTKWMNDFEVTDYIGGSSKVVTLTGERTWLEDMAKNRKDISLEIVTLDEDKLIGTISLDGFNMIDRSAVLGIFIGDSDYRSHGYGTEAIKLMLEYGFKYLNLHSIRLDVLDVNERAHKCYLKCGFKDTGRDRERVFLNGKYYDMLHMDILENEFAGDYIRNKNVR